MSKGKNPNKPCPSATTLPRQILNVVSLSQMACMQGIRWHPTFLGGFDPRCGSCISIHALVLEKIRNTNTENQLLTSVLHKDQASCGSLRQGAAGQATHLSQTDFEKRLRHSIYSILSNTTLRLYMWWLVRTSIIHCGCRNKQTGHASSHPQNAACPEKDSGCL